jgi:hypothetical protein
MYPDTYAQGRGWMAVGPAEGPPQPGTKGENGSKLMGARPQPGGAAPVTLVTLRTKLPNTFPLYAPGR